MTVYLVVFYNYHPLQLDSVWSTLELAEARTATLGGMWNVVEYVVDTEPPE